MTSASTGGVLSYGITIAVPGNGDRAGDTRAGGAHCLFRPRHAHGNTTSRGFLRTARQARHVSPGRARKKEQKQHAELGLARKGSRRRGGDGGGRQLGSAHHFEVSAGTMKRLALRVVSPAPHLRAIARVSSRARGRNWERNVRRQKGCARLCGCAEAPPCLHPRSACTAGLLRSRRQRRGRALRCFTVCWPGPGAKGAPAGGSLRR